MAGGDITGGALERGGRLVLAGFGFALVAEGFGLKAIDLLDLNLVGAFCHGRQTYAL